MTTQNKKKIYDSVMQNIGINKINHPETNALFRRLRNIIPTFSRVIGGIFARIRRKKIIC